MSEREVATVRLDEEALLTLLQELAGRHAARPAGATHVRIQLSAQPRVHAVLTYLRRGDP